MPVEPKTEFDAAAETPVADLPPAVKRRKRPPTGVFGGRNIEWRNNVPVPVYTEPTKFAADEAKELQVRALLSPYRGTYDKEFKIYTIEPEFEGMTNYQVACYRRAMAAAEGNLGALSQIEDRIFGKPKQQVESVSMKVSYQDYLDSFADDTDDEMEEVLNAEFTESPPAASSDDDFYEIDAEDLWETADDL